MKILLVVIAIPVVYFLTAFAWVFFEIQVLYPRQYARLQTEVEAWNKENWETGMALRVSVQVSSDKTLGDKTNVATINCYRKQFARAGGIKGPPAIQADINSDGPKHLVIPFGPDAMHSTPLEDVCREALQHRDDWELPYVTESYSYQSHILANDHSFRCFMAKDARTTRGEVSRPTIIAVEQVPLSAFISAEVYNALHMRRKAHRTQRAVTYRWLTDELDTACWRRNSRDICAPDVEAICGSPLR